MLLWSVGKRIGEMYRGLWLSWLWLCKCCTLVCWNINWDIVPSMVNVHPLQTARRILFYIRYLIMLFFTSCLQEHWRNGVLTTSFGHRWDSLWYWPDWTRHPASPVFLRKWYLVYCRLVMLHFIWIFFCYVSFVVQHQHWVKGSVDQKLRCANVPVIFETTKLTDAFGPLLWESQFFCERDPTNRQDRSIHCGCQSSYMY